MGCEKWLGSSCHSSSLISVGLPRRLSYPLCAAFVLSGVGAEILKNHASLAGSRLSRLRINGCTSDSVCGEAAERFLCNVPVIVSRRKSYRCVFVMS